MTTTTTPMQALTLSVEALRTQVRTSPANEGVLADMLQSIFTRTKGVLDNIFTRKLGEHELLGLKAEYEREDSYKHLKAGDFPLLARQPLDTMEGFIGKYVDYTPVVLSNLNYFKDLDESLKHYRILVGSLINNRASRASWEDLTPRFEASAKQREASNVGNAEFWAPASHATLVTVGTVVSRLADLQQLDKDGEAVKQAVREHDLSKIKVRLDEINSLTQVLATEIEKGRIADLTRAQITNLANGIMELAYQAEHFSIAVYRAHVYLNALKRLQDVVKAYH